MKEMTLSIRESATVFCVIDELLRKSYAELNYTFGTETIQNMQKLWSKMRYADYCDEHGIAYEDMTEDDFVNAYLEMNEI